MSPRPASNGPLDASPNTRGPFDQSSPTAIIVVWVLTAFVPLPLIFCLIIICYFPNALPKLTLPSIFLRVRQGSKLSAFSFSSSRSASTPSSYTLAVSNTSSYTLPVSNLRSITPLSHNPNSSNYPSPSTPQISSPASSRYPTTPLTSKTTPDSVRTPAKPNIIHAVASGLFCPASESPRSLSFLEPPSIRSTPHKSYTRLPSNNSRKPSVPSTVGSPPTPCVLRYRRLRRRFLVSVILLFLIFALYLVEGFAITAAQEYAHVRVLGHTNSRGGLGKGKEDEKWLIPWIIYVFLQGGLVLGSLWMVNGLRREARRLARDCSDEKGNDIQRPSENALGDIELQALGNQEERDTFVPASEDSQGVVLRNKVEKGETLGIEEEEEWEALGFDPVSAFSEQASAAKPANRRLASTLPDSTGFISPNGEGSSSGPSYSAGFSFDGRADEPGILPSSLPGVGNHWRAERSPAEMKLQRRSTVTRRSRPDFETGSTTKVQHPFLQDGPVGRPSINTRNSWEQDDDAKERYLETSSSVVGKGKGKEKEEEEEKERGTVEPIADGKDEDKQEPESRGFDSPTGIDLN
ncbi:MAG: hypothetical protein Q9172_006231, partial [Xanthocarpia lactea]